MFAILDKAQEKIILDGFASEAEAEAEIELLLAEEPWLELKVVKLA